MKKAILVLTIGVLSVFGGNDLFAQKKNDPDSKIENRIKKMDEKLNLTDEQEVKMRELFTRQMKAKEEQKARRKAHQIEMKSILTEEQFAKLEQMRQEKAQAKGKNKKRHTK
ncbi:MAG: hypothetical protein ACXWW0_07005 [Bacteroidia bacterium]